MMLPRRMLLATSFGAPRIASAQPRWPERPVRLLVPFPAGSAVDTLSRLVADKLGEKLGQPVLPDNRPGASANIAMEALARSPADGYTLGVAVTGIWLINPFIFSHLSYDPDRDLAPISPVWTQTNVMVVAAGHNPAVTMQEFLRWARERRGRLAYGHSGSGTTPHLCAELFNRRESLQATAIPYRGSAQIVTALLRGDVDFSFDNLAGFAPLLPEGQIRALGVTSEDRWPTLREVPTMAEGGIPDFVVSTFASLAAPAGTPRPIIARINQAVREASSEETNRQRFLVAGARTLWSTPEELWSRVQRERPMWQEMVRISGARAD
jgi:tripartite-type tricarboxylate transporter receptor subunit TctC